jgi:hypothetical protein
MSEQIFAGAATGALAGGAVAGVPGAIAGGVLGGILGDAYSKKPVAEHHATSVQNDLAPETVSLDAHQIYVRITGGHGPNSLVEAHEAASKLSTNFAERANQIAAARGAAAGAWQGNAADAADAATTPLADSFALAQQQLAANSQALNTEVAAFDHIRSQVEFVPATPPQSGIANSANPFQTDVDAAINEYNAKAAKNVQLYEAYSAETAAARSQVPQSYAQPAPLSASATGATSTASPIGAASVPPPQVGSAADTAAPAATNASATPGGGAPKPPSPSGASGMPSGTAGQGAAATDQTARPTPSPPPMPAGSVRAASDTFGSGPLPSQARSTGASDLPRKTTGAGPGIGGVPGGVGAFGGGAGPRATGTGGGTGTGSGPALRGGSSVGTGPAPGQTPPGAGQPINRGPIGARGAAGAGGMPMGAPGGRANGEEDQEHRRKYLIEPDDKELFGVDEQYVQPVIGDNR